MSTPSLRFADHNVSQSIVSLKVLPLDTFPKIQKHTFRWDMSVTFVLKNLMNEAVSVFSNEVSYI